MKKRESISKIMTTDVLSVNVTNSLREVVDIVKDKDVRHVPVLSGDKIIGMLSNTDIQKISFVNTMDGDKITTVMYDALTLEQVMTKELKTLQIDDLIYDAAVVLSDSQFHALPILDGEKFVGIVTTTDLLKYLVSLY